MSDILERNIRLEMDARISSDFRAELHYLTQGVAFTKEHHARTVLAAAMANPSSLDMGTITTGTVFMISTDRAIKVGIDTSTNLLDIAANGMFCIVGPFTAVYVQNVDANYTATVEYAMTD